MEDRDKQKDKLREKSNKDSKANKESSQKEMNRQKKLKEKRKTEARKVKRQERAIENSLDGDDLAIQKKLRGLNRRKKSKMRRKWDKKKKAIDKKFDAEKDALESKKATTDGKDTPKQKDISTKLEKLEIDRKKAKGRQKISIYFQIRTIRLKSRLKKAAKMLWTVLKWLIALAPIPMFIAMNIFFWGGIVAVMMSHPTAIKELAKDGYLGYAIGLTNVREDVKVGGEVVAKKSKQTNDGIFTWYGAWNTDGVTEDMGSGDVPPESIDSKTPAADFTKVETAKPDDSGKATNIKLTGMNKTIIDKKLPNPDTYEKGFKTSSDPLTPKGVVIHEVASPGATIENVMKYTDGQLLISPNNAFYHGITGKDYYIKTYDYAKKAYGAYDPANSNYVHIEMENTTDTNEFYRVINNNAYAIAKILKELKLKPQYYIASGKEPTTLGKGTLITHHDVSTVIGTGDHIDPVSYFASHKYTVPEFVDLVIYKFDKMAD